MATVDRETVLRALSTVMDPDLGRDLVSLNMIRDLEVEGDAVKLRLVLTTPACPLKDKIRGDVTAALAEIGVQSPEIVMDAETRRAPGGGADEAAARLPGVKAVVAVASGKGGVGKSTVAVNLAIALQQTGAKVGLLDADIYGPSLPTMMGMKDAMPTASGDKRIHPVGRYDIKVMSMGFLMGEDDAVVWRGPMIARALQQFIEDVEWGELDYLVVDLPPGTGDIQISLTQLLPVTGAIIVTTPQDVALADVVRAIRGFTITNTRVLGLVENMSYFVCDSCDKKHHIFGESRIASHAAAASTDVLAQIPLDSVTAVAADRGEPIVLAAPDSQGAQAYHALAGELCRKVAIIAHEAASQAAEEEGGKPVFNIRGS